MQTPRCPSEALKEPPRTLHDLCRRSSLLHETCNTPHAGTEGICVSECIVCERINKAIGTTTPNDPFINACMRRRAGPVMVARKPAKNPSKAVHQLASHLASHYELCYTANCDGLRSAAIWRALCFLLSVSPSLEVASTVRTLHKCWHWMRVTHQRSSKSFPCGTLCVLQCCHFQHVCQRFLCQRRMLL